MDAERLGSMSGWCWERVLGEVPKALSMSFSAEGGREMFITCLLYYRSGKVTFI